MPKNVQTTAQLHSSHMLLKCLKFSKPGFSNTWTVNLQTSPGILEWVAYPFSRGISWARNWTGVSCIAIHTVKGFGIVNKAEIDVFLKFSCFLCDPTYVGYLISGSSAFSKSILNIRTFSIHILLKPSLENFEPSFDSMWDELKKS